MLMALMFPYWIETTPRAIETGKRVSHLIFTSIFANVNMFYVLGLSLIKYVDYIWYVDGLRLFIFHEPVRTQESLVRRSDFSPNRMIYVLHLLIQWGRANTKRRCYLTGNERLNMPTPKYQ